MTSALDSYMRKRLLSAPLWKCTRFLFVGSKVNSLQVLGFSPKRLQSYNNFLNLPNLGALFLNFLQIFYIFSNERAVIGRGFPTVYFIGTLAVLRMRVKHLAASLLHTGKERSILHFVISFALFN